MKLPKNWNKLSNKEQREWIARAIQALNADLQQALSISRSLQYGKPHVVDGLEDRPDLAMLKHG